MSDSNRIFGIDLGTTYSCIAYVDENGRAVVIPGEDSRLAGAGVGGLAGAGLGAGIGAALPRSSKPLSFLDFMLLKEHASKLNTDIYDDRIWEGFE